MLPPTLQFLMAYSHLSGDSQTRDHLELTLDRMALGGVFDQIGGGFFRYSTDPRWHIPHFEKMLYDNAQLLGVFSKAYSVFSKPEYKRVAERIFTFLKRDMKAPEGGYYAALDADTEGEEGKYYLWQTGELEALLGDGFPRFAACYGIGRDLDVEVAVPALPPFVDQGLGLVERLRGQRPAQRQRPPPRLRPRHGLRRYPTPWWDRAAGRDGPHPPPPDTA